MACRRPRPRWMLAQPTRLFSHCSPTASNVEEGNSSHKGKVVAMTGISCKYFLCSLYANAITLSTDARSLLRIGFSIRAVDNKVRSGVAGFESATVVWDRRSPLFSIFYRSDRTHLSIPAPLVCTSHHHVWPTSPRVYVR